MNRHKLICFLILFFGSITIYAGDTIYLNPYFKELKTTDVIIDGKKYKFLFDSGGGETFISPAIANTLNKEIYGSSTGIRMDGEMIKYQKANSVSIKMGSTDLFHPTIGVWDIMSILPKELPTIDRVLSLKSFANRILTIDLSKNILIIENKNSLKKQTKTKTLVPSRFANGPDGAESAIFIGIPKQNNFYWFLFDTGNIGDIILSPECAQLWALQTDTKSANISNTTTKGEFMIGNNKVESNTYSKKIIYDGVLNFASISKFVFTIDFERKQVWMY